MRFANGYHPATFTLLDAKAPAGTSTHWTLTLRLQMTRPDSAGDANFVDSSFRLLQDALPPGPRQVAIAGPAEVTFTRSTRIAYTVLAAGTEARRPGVLGLNLRMRMTAFDAGGGNFGDSSLRLVVDDNSIAPDSNLNELVGARAAKDANLSFELPAGASEIVLRIRRSDAEVAELPLRLEATR